MSKIARSKQSPKKSTARPAAPSVDRPVPWVPTPESDPLVLIRAALGTPDATAEEMASEIRTLRSILAPPRDQEETLPWPSQEMRERTIRQLARAWRSTHDAVTTQRVRDHVSVSITDGPHAVMPVDEWEAAAMDGPARDDDAGAGRVLEDSVPWTMPASSVVDYLGKRVLDGKDDGSEPWLIEGECGHLLRVDALGGGGTVIRVRMVGRTVGGLLLPRLGVSDADGDEIPAYDDAEEIAAAERGAA